MSSEIVIRPAEPDDIKFIMSSWKQSWRVCPWAGCIRNDEYFKSITSTIDGLIGRGAALSVACSPESPGRILGWACTEVLADGFCCVHYVYVKDPFLRMGIGQKLVDSSPGSKPGLYTFRFKQVVESCQGFKHAAEVARRK